MGWFKGKLKKVFGTKDNDDIDGGPENEILFGKQGDDDVRGGNGNDIVKGGSGDDIVGGGAGNDIVIGGSGDDIVNGGNGKDLLIGGSGDDRIVGSGQGDALFGGSGADIFRIDATGFKDVILDFKYHQGDRIDIPNGYSFENATIKDNGWSIFGVTVTFEIEGKDDVIVQILGVKDADDVQADWFI